MRHIMVRMLTWLLLTSTTATAEVTSLDLPLRFIRDTPVTRIEVAGREVDVIVDTGGAHTLVLDPEILSAVNAIPSGNAVTTRDVFGVSREQARFRVPEVTLDGRTFTHLSALAAASDTGAPLPNVLGREFLRQFLVIIDYSNRKLRLAAPSTRDREALGCHGARVPFARDDATGLVVTTALSGAGRWRLLWDTGAARSQLPIRTARDYRLRTDRDANGRSSYTTGRLLLNGTDFGPLELAVANITLPGDIDGILGHDFFLGHVVCIDYQRRELRVR